MENTGKKKTTGRRKIEIKKIEKKNSLQVTFSKRRKGLFNKANELSLLCGVDIAVLAQSPAGKVHANGNIHPGLIMDRYLNGESNAQTRVQESRVGVENQKKSCLEIMKNLEAEKRVEKAIEQSKRNNTKELWWKEPCDHMDLHELEEYMAALDMLKNKVMIKAEEKARASTPKTSSLAPNFTVDSSGGRPIWQYESGGSNNSMALILFKP